MSKVTKAEFFGSGFFDWQYSDYMCDKNISPEEYKEKYWGDFPHGEIDMSAYKIPEWAISGFRKYNRPVLAPSVGGWDRGHTSGGVHNGSVLYRDGNFRYIYRGEEPIPDQYHKVQGIGYICDIGIAESKDGINFKKLTEFNPFLRAGGDEKYSFEDVNVVEYDGKYYMFLNRWDWTCMNDPSVCGVFLAVSDDMLHWEKLGLVFPDAKRIHRNPVVVQNPDNRAVKIGGKFVMFINDGLMGFSDDLIHWESEELSDPWPGGEGCFAIADYDTKNPDNVILFTGGHHTGHFYALGEVLFNKKNIKKPIEWLPRPAMTVEPQYPWENGCSMYPPYNKVSTWLDTIFFTGMTRHDGLWWIYYGGSEYYTCLAVSDDIKQ